MLGLSKSDKITRFITSHLNPHAYEIHIYVLQILVVVFCAEY